ncbi:hypothetical protein ACERK3_15930 [Phycisphaerales bacterium AB-hyl4]|uniref:Uncharacterized protein n=1 Tax=Natronomicrosphaera hydrolytica TaxID=3242702 RepID=A0ABV4U834_9BACT
MSSRLSLVLLVALLLVGCVATEVKDTTRLANVRTTIERSEVEGLEYLESRVNEYNGSYSAQAVQAIIANRYADAGHVDVVILLTMERQPTTLRTRAMTATERRRQSGSFDAEWDDRPGFVTETVPGDWLVEERVYRAGERVGVVVE